MAASSIFARLSEPLPEAAPKGGWRQRAAANAAKRVHCSGVRSRLVESEIKAWANGTISSAKLWQFVSDMHEDGFHHPAAERIRSCGHSSTDQSVANNFIKLLESCGLGALRDEINGGTVTCIILPSKPLGWMFKQSRQRYYEATCGRLRSFGQGFGTNLSAICCLISTHTCEAEVWKA